MGHYGFLLSFSLRPTTPLESAQQFNLLQANTEQYALTGPIFQTFWLINYDGERNRLAAARHLFPLFKKGCEISLISSGFFLNSISGDDQSHRTKCFFQIRAGRGVGGALRSPVVADAAGRTLGERQLRLSVPLWRTRSHEPGDPDPDGQRGVRLLSPNPRTAVGPRVARPIVEPAGG